MAAEFRSLVGVAMYISQQRGDVHQSAALRYPMQCQNLGIELEA